MRCQTSSALGYSCCRAPIRVRITASAHCLPASQPSMLAPTTKAYGKWCRRFWTWMSAANTTRRGKWPVCPCSSGAEAAYWASWADALPMISERSPAVADHVEHAMTHEVHHEGVWPSSTTPAVDWTGKGSGGDPLGHSGGMAKDLQTASRVNPAGGNTTGSSGLLPSLTPTSGRTQFCHFVLPLVKPTSGRTRVTCRRCVGMRANHSRMHGAASLVPRASSAKVATASSDCGSRV